MKRRLCIFLSSSIFALCVQANTLVVTRGPICFGMGSYLTNAIESLNDNYHSFTQYSDHKYSLAGGIYDQVFNELFPQQMAIIRRAIDPKNVYPAIFNYHVYFKNTVHEQQKEQVFNALSEIRNALNDPANDRLFASLDAMIKHSIMVELAYHAACGNNIVWEGGTVYNYDRDAFIIKGYFDNVIETLTYTAPTAMIEEWKQKNDRAIKEQKAYDRRLVKQVLQTFFNNFKLAEIGQDGVVALTRDEFDAIIEQAACYIKIVPQSEFGENGIFTKSEFTLEELSNFKKTIYEIFNFDNVDCVTLVPTLSHDVLLSSREECLHFAQSLKNK